MNFCSMTLKQLQKAFNNAMLTQDRDLMAAILKEINSRPTKNG